MSDPLDDYAIAAKQLKETLVAKEGVGTDIRPLLVLRSGGTTLGVVQLRGAEVTTASMLTVAAFRPEEVISTCEAYVDPSRLGDHGDLSERFPTDPAVWEVVMVSHSIPGYARGCLLPYRYVGRTVEWQDETGRDRDVPVLSPLARAIDSGFRSSIDPMKALHALQTLEVVIQSAELKCPCGSNKPFTICCLSSSN
jgi:hypothetical protein